MRAWGPMSVFSHPRSDYRLSRCPQKRRCRPGPGWGQGADSAASLRAPPDFQSCVPSWGWGWARGARGRRRRRGEPCAGRMKTPPSSGGPGQVADGPSESRGRGTRSPWALARRLRALGAAEPAGVRGQLELGQERGARGRRCWGWPGGGAPAAGRLQRSRSRCCSAALTVDWFYSPRIKPALPSSRRQPPRGKPTLPRPLRLSSAGLAPSPRVGPWGALLPWWDGLFGEAGTWSEGFKEPGEWERPLLGIGRAAPGRPSRGQLVPGSAPIELGRRKESGGPWPESGAAPTGTSSTRSSLVLGRAALARKGSWR